MKLVIRAEQPLTLRRLRGPFRTLLAQSVENETSRAGEWERIKELAEPYRAYVPKEEWAAEEEALAEILCMRPLGQESVPLFVQTLPVPADLPVPLLPLLTGFAITEKSKWAIESFSPLAMLWLREANVRTLERLQGRLLRVEQTEGLAVLQWEEETAGGEIPLLWEQKDHTDEHIDEGMLIMQINLDDSSPEWLAHVMEICFQAGANDVHFLPVTMKKSRPGQLLQVMCYQSQADALKTILFSETTTFGIRSFPVACHRLARRFVTVETEWGKVAVKLGYHRQKRVQVAPEYAHCAKVAHAAGIPLKQVYHQAIMLAEAISPIHLPETRQEEEHF